MFGAAAAVTLAAGLCHPDRNDLSDQEMLTMLGTVAVLSPFCSIVVKPSARALTWQELAKKYAAGAVYPMWAFCQTIGIEMIFR